MSDRKIVEYMLLDETSEMRFVGKIKNLITIGWQPLGACFIYLSAGGIVYNQTLVQYEDNGNEHQE